MKDESANVTFTNGWQNVASTTSSWPVGTVVLNFNDGTTTTIGEVTTTATTAGEAAATLKRLVSKGLSEEQIATAAEGILELAGAEGAVEEERANDALPTWEAVLAFEGLPTSDRRYLIPGEIDERELPLSFMAQTATNDGHNGAEVAGKITNIWREPRTDLGEKVVAIMGSGEFFDNDMGREAAKLVEEEMLRGVSLDLATREVAILDAESFEPIEDEEEVAAADLFGGGNYLRGVKGTIMGATLVPFPAFGDAHMQVVYPESALVASTQLWNVQGPQIWLVREDEGANITAGAAGLVPLAPPREWFEMPEPDLPTPLTVTDDGRVYGHLALWNQCHAGFPGCEVANRSKSGYAYFHTGSLKCDDGSEINVGRITVGDKGGAKGGHASIVLGTKGAIEHYDNTACVGAYVRATDGKLGIWLSGSVRSDCPAERVRDMKANPPSGDWRWERGCRELVAALCVPVGGFAIPRFEARVASAGEEDVVMALVATGYVPREIAAMNRSEQRRLIMLKARAREALALVGEE